jgi:catechol 2,3-dioxygenase-like lactoylglutathione lyase family enzyme
VRPQRITVKLNHLDLQTTDVQALATFFVDHFDLHRRSNDRSPAICILGDEGGFTLVLQAHDEPRYPDGFHIGFIRDSVASVEAHHARLAAAGLRLSPIDVNNRGTRFYLRGPGELLVEVSTPARATS